MGLLLHCCTHPKVMTNMLKKVFNWSKVHLSDVTSYKIHTLEHFMAIFKDLCPCFYSPLNSAKLSCSREVTLSHMTCHIFGALAHFCKTMHKTLLSKIVFIEEAVCKKKERTICFFDNFQKPSEPHSMGKY